MFLLIILSTVLIACAFTIIFIVHYSTKPQALNINQCVTATASNQNQKCWGRRRHFPFWRAINWQLL